jgi:exosortase
MVAATDSSTRRPGEANVPADEHRWGELGVHLCTRIGIIACLFCSFFRHDLERIVRRWVTDPSWSHGFLIPLFSLYFLHQRRRDILGLRFERDPLAELLRGRRPGRLAPGQTRPNYLGWAFLVAALAFYVFNLLSPSGYAYLRALCAIAALGAIVLLLGGWRLVRHTWLPIVYLAFAVPLPRRLYVEFTMPMRRLATTVATALLNLLPGVEAAARGVIIDVVSQGTRLEPPLNVAEACSGMRLLMAFLALGVAMAYLHDRPLWQRLGLLASTVPIAILCNIVRVTATAFIYVLLDPRYTQGIYHDALGLAMLPLAFGCYGFLAWFLASLFVDEAGAEAAADVVVRTRRQP